MKRAAPLRLNALCVAKMIRYMQDVPCSIHDMADVTGLSIPTARRFALALAREGATHVSGWEQDGLGRYTTKVYAFGVAKNAPKPRPDKPLAARRQERRARQRHQAMVMATAGAMT